MERKKLIIWFLLLAIVNVAHGVEELLGHLFIIDIIGDSVFIVLVCMVLGFAVFSFFQNLKGRHWAYKVMLVYGVAMIMNGVGHVVGRMLLEDWLGNMAGEYTGAVLIVLAPTFLIHLIRWRQSISPDHTVDSQS